MPDDFVHGTYIDPIVLAPRSKQYASNEEIFAHFPIGAKVRFENEAFAKHWEYGIVTAHTQSWTEGDGIRIRDEEGYPVEFDLRYLDIDPKLSLVRLIKEG